MSRNLRKKYPRNILIDIIIITGIILISWSFISELYFHYIADFTLDNLEPELFWRAEYSELVNSMFLLISGIILLTFGMILKFNANKKTRSR